MTAAAGSVFRYHPFFKHRQAQRVLDYGAGKLRNSLFLAESGFHVYAADIPEQAAWIRSCPLAARLAGIFDTGELAAAPVTVDLVISTYVLNIIPAGAEQRRYLANAASALRPGGYLLVEVRCRREHVVCGDDCSHFQKCPNCARSYSHKELDALVSPFGFRCICHYYRRHALAAVFQRTD